MSRNAEIAAILEEFADLLDAQRVEYKPRSYRRAADNVREHPEPIEELASEGTDAVGRIEGVGDAISSKIVEYVETGSIEELEALREELPVAMEELTAVEGVGPKTVGDLYEALGVTTLDELEEAARNEEIREVKGYGPKTEENILSNVEFAREARERALLGQARPVADGVLARLEREDAVERCAVAGSIRRWRPTVGDVDVLAASEDPEAVVEALTGWGRVERVMQAGTMKASVRAAGVQVDLRVVAPDEYGAALQYFTGSKDHNVRVRNRALAQDLKVNEYGVFDTSGVDDPDAGQRVGERLASETEETVYDAIGMAWMPPELREDRGEVDAAAEGTLPDLVETIDVRGELHTHTNWSDGDLSIEGLIDAAARFGHEYLAITDHATGPGMVGGVGVEDDELREQAEVIRDAAADAPIEVFTGVEANIDADGNVSVADDVLADLDLVVASPHSGLDGDGTDRLVRAIEHPEIDVLGHPSGRMLNSRSGMEIDPRRLGEAAAENDVALEVNANPHRLDLWGSAVKAAVEAGAIIAVNTDAHRPSEFDYLRYGVHTARRGWAEAGDVLNTRDVAGVRAFLE